MSELRTSRWIELDGADNVRDLGGLPTLAGGTVLPGRLIRSDSLQDLTEADVRYLVDEVGVRSVADLRTGVEVAAEGPGPMTREPLVRVEHLSLFPEPEEVRVSDSDDGPVVLPWQQRDAGESDAWQSDAGQSGAGQSGAGQSGAGQSGDVWRRGASGVYLRYLDDRADSVLAALRLIAEPDGATIVHCAAGKDRTGVVVALALIEVGVEPAAVVQDYALSAERVEAILARLVARRTYATDLVKDESIDTHKPKPETMERLLTAMAEQYGGVGRWLRANGWTEQDAAALRGQLLG